MPAIIKERQGVVLYGTSYKRQCGLKRIRKVLYKKWVKGNCNHCCSFCKYKKVCLKENWY